MKAKYTRILSLLLAVTLQVLPFVRTILPKIYQGLVPSSWAVVFRWAAGGTALMGYHAISSASSIAISPANATNGVPYVGTVTYAGTHAGSVSSMKLTNTCLTGSTPFLAGLNIVYASANTATVSGTPNTTGTFPFQLRIYDGICAGETDTRYASLVIGTGTGSTAPSITAAPQSLTTQIGASTLFSAGASGNPVPKYYWYIGVPSPATLVGTNSSLSFTNVQLTNAGLYTVVASNASGTAQANAFLSVCRTPGNNMLALYYTNYVPVSNAVFMTTYITNAPAGSNVYKFQFNFGDITSYSQSGSNLNLAANQVFAGHSGVYSILFNSAVAGTTIVDQQIYDSYWAFGSGPVLNSSPQSTNVLAGTNVTLSATASVVRTPYTNQPVLFSWYRNGTNLLSSQTAVGTPTTFTESGVTVYAYSNAASSLTLSNVAPADSGSYTVVASNFWGTATSAPASLSVTSSVIAPGIIAQPSPKSVLIGQNTSFLVTASGTAPLSYQWQKVGLGNLSNGGVYSGVNTNVLTVTGVQSANAGSYLVVITNSAGSTNSSTVTLTVSSPPTVTLQSAGPNSAQLGVTTVPGLTYVVQSTTNLSNATTWTPLTTNLVPGNGIALFTNSTVRPAQFFRFAFP